MVLTMAAVYAVTAVVGILPGGIGVREGLVAYLGTAGGLAAAAGFAASALDRLLGLAAHMPVALFLASRHVPSPSLDESSDVG